MSHSLSRIWIHGIWATKEFYPFISDNIEKDVYGLLYDEHRALHCPARIINGMPVHVHSLFLLNPTKAVSDVMQHIKGISSHTINEQDLTFEKFCWQTGFAAYSVSESQVEKVYNYIKFQKGHHLKKTFQHEFDELAKLHGIPK